MAVPLPSKEPDRPGSYLPGLGLDAVIDGTQTGTSPTASFNLLPCHPCARGVVTSPSWLTLMLSNCHWPSIPCFLRGGLPHPGQRVQDRLRAARVMTLVRVKLRP